MKRIIFIVLVLFFSLKSFAQTTSNEARIKALPELIGNAVADEDYDQAAKLKKELEIREELKKAVEEEDFKKATSLREDLYALESGDLEIKEDNSDYNEETSTEIEEVEKRDNSVFYMDFNVAGLNIYSYDVYSFVDIYDANGNYVGSEETYERVFDRDFSFNFKLGHKFFFGSDASNIRLGLDLNYVNLNIGLPMIGNSNDADVVNILPNINISTPSPGLALTYLFREDTGIDFQMNFGAIFMLSSYNQTILPNTGFHVNPQVKWWSNKFSVGLEYLRSNVSEPVDQDRNLVFQHFGFSVGLRL